MFTIPNLVDAGFVAQAEPDAKDIEIMVAGAAGHGVIQGCAVSAQGTPDMTVAVAVGTVQIDGWRARKVAAGNVNIGAADATDPRIDLVCVDTTGTKQVVAGTAAAAPVLPAITAGYVVLAAVYVPATDTAINAPQIVDKRIALSPLMVAAPGAVRVMSDFLNKDNDTSFLTAALGTGASVTNATANADEWGLLKLDTGTQNTGHARVRSIEQALFGAGKAVAAVAVETDSTLSDGTTRYTLRAGWIDGQTSDPTNGVLFRYTDNVNAGKWQCVTRNNGVESTADSGVAVATATRYLLEIEINADGSLATFFINGSQVATIATNIPTAAGRVTGVGAAINNVLGTTARALYVDKIDMVHLPLNPY